MMRQLMDPGYSMFTFNSRGLYWFAPLKLPELEPEFELVGILLGLALFHSNGLEFAFPKLIFRCGRDRLLALLATVYLRLIVKGLQCRMFHAGC